MSRLSSTYVEVFKLFVFFASCALFGVLVGRVLLPFTVHWVMREPTVESSYAVPPRSRLTCPRANAAAFEFTNESLKHVTVHFTGEVTCNARSLP